MRTLTRKGYGRIYCDTPDDVATVRAIVQEMDAFEYEYMPEDIVAPFSAYPAVVYTHKFDGLDLDALTATCWARGVKIWVFDARHEEFPGNAIKEATS